MNSGKEKKGDAECNARNLGSTGVAFATFCLPSSPLIHFIRNSTPRRNMPHNSTSFAFETSCVGAPHSLRPSSPDVFSAHGLNPGAPSGGRTVYGNLGPLLLVKVINLHPGATPPKHKKEKDIFPSPRAKPPQECKR